MTWIQTVSGRALSFLTPDPDAIDIGDICYHLSGMRRFTNATCVPWTVAAHSRLVHLIVKETVPSDVAAQLWALMHDYHEYATGDRSTPLQRAEAVLLPSGWPAPIKTIQDRLDRAIAQRFQIDWRDVEESKDIVKRADLIALATEKAQFMATEQQSWGDLPPPYDIELVPLGEAQTEWLLRNDFEKALAAYHRSKSVKEAAE